MAPYRLLSVLGSSSSDCRPPEMPGRYPVQSGIALLNVWWHDAAAQSAAKGPRSLPSFCSMRQE